MPADALTYLRRRGLAAALAVTASVMSPGRGSGQLPPSLTGGKPSGAAMATGDTAAEPVTMRLVADRTALVAGESIRLGVLIDMEEGWHVYGKDAGDIGQPTRVEWELPPALSASDVRFPKPKADVFDLGEEQMVSWVYEKQALLWSDVTVSADATAGPEPLVLRASVRYMVCKTGGVCLPPRSRVLEMSLPVAAEGAASAEAPLFERYPPAEPGTGPAGAAPPGAAAGLGLPVNPQVQAVADLGLWRAILYGLLAGLILNVMPCVLPVISIKILSLVQQAAEDRREILRLGLAFSAGILAVFLVLAALAAFAGLTWGGQFQSRGFLVAMIALIFVFSLAMFGVFEIGLPGRVSEAAARQKGEGYWGSFGIGAMATVLATPCSGPFLGATLGYALRQPPRVIFAIFSAVGIGMALPYLLLSIHPAWARFLPRPGPWMTRFKQLMGFVLLATAVYLMTILPADWVVWTVAFCLGLGISAFVWGQLCSFRDSLPRIAAVRGLAVLIALLSGWLAFGYFLPRQAGAGQENRLPWEPFSVARLLELTAERRTVLVDFTADWCPNCKLNEVWALNTPETLALVKEYNIACLLADWTERDEEIRQILESLGSVSVPLTAIFPAGRPEQPIVIRDTYRKSTLLEKLRAAVSPAPAGS